MQKFFKKRKNGTDPELKTSEAVITIRVDKNPAGQWTSNHQFENIEPAQAAQIMMDVARNVFLSLIHHHGDH